MKSIRVGINGFGRIGRVAMRIALGRKDIQIVAINSRADVTSHAYLLKYDSIYGTLPHQIKVKLGKLLIDQHSVAIFQESDPAAIPWQKVGADIILEATGNFRRLEEAKKHLKTGAKRVIVTAPAKDKMPTVCLGVNEDVLDLKRDFIVSNASCTTNCLASVAKVINDEFEIVRGFMTTTHAYTDSQNLLDNSHKKDLRLTRSAPNNIIPMETGASKALGLVIPQLNGKISAMAIRIPVPIVSLIDLTVQTVHAAIDAASVNAVFSKAAKGAMKGILDYSREPLVSSDLKGTSYSAVIDGLLSQVNGQMINVKAWYDNEWGYATRLIDLAVLMGRGL